MVSGYSNITEIVSIRLPRDAAARARVNAGKRGATLSQYLAAILMRQLGRKK